MAKVAKVAIVDCLSYDPLEVNKALDGGLNLIGGLERFVKKGDKVFVKLNLLMKKTPEEAVTNHPVLVEALVTKLQQIGAIVTIGDSPGGPFTKGSLKSIYRATGIEGVAERTGASLNWELGEVDVSFPEGKIGKGFKLCKAMVEADKLISLSKLKTHQMTRFTGAVKVLFGAIPGLQKAEYHLKMPKVDDFCQMLVDLACCVKPVLNIMDGVIGMEGAGPSAGVPRKVGKILISPDPFALDFIAIRQVGLDPRSIPTARLSEGQGLFKAQDIEIIGQPLIPLMPPFDAPNIKGEVRFPVPKIISNILRPKPVFSPEICIGCGICQEHCPPKVIEIKEKFPQVDLDQCIRCFCCQELCPHKAIRVKRNWAGKLLTK